MTETTDLASSRLQEPINIIIPAYNEAERIGNVLGAAIAVPYRTRIIVVDDASSDDTAAVVRRWQQRDSRIHLVTLPDNRGKTGAIAAGLQHAAGDIVTFLDADLSGLTSQHIHKLIEPVRRGQCAMTIGIFRHGRMSTDVTHRYLPFLSGQRCLRWSRFEDVGLPADTGWSLEIALNLHSWFHQYEAQRVVLEGVTHAMRPEKQPGLRGYTSHVAMWWHIGRYTLEFVEQQGVVPILNRLQDTGATHGYQERPRGFARDTDPLLTGRPFL